MISEDADIRYIFSVQLKDAVLLNNNLGDLRTHFFINEGSPVVWG